METIEHFAKISLVARLLGGENLLSREEVAAAAGAARHLRHRGAGADLRRPGAGDAAGGRRPTCQVVEAPAGGGRRLVPEPTGCPARSRALRPSGDEEIRLTYRELTALIEDAVRAWVAAASVAS